MIEIHELKEVLETLEEMGYLRKKEISYQEFLKIWDVVNKNLKEEFHQRIREEMVIGEKCE